MALFVEYLDHGEDGIKFLQNISVILPVNAALYNKIFFNFIGFLRISSLKIHNNFKYYKI